MAFQNDAFQDDAFQNEVTGPSLGLIDRTAVAFAPTLTYNSFVALGLISQTAVAFAPTTTRYEGAFQGDAFQNDAFQVDDAGAQVAFALINQTAVAFAPTVATTGTQFITLQILAVPAVAFAPSVSFPGQITLPLINNTAQAGVHVVSSSQPVALPLINRTAVAFSPTVTVPFDQDVFLGLINQTAVAFAPVVLFTTDVNGVPTPDPTVVELFYDGTDIIDDVVIADATFTSLVNGQPGNCRFRVKDTPNTHSFVAGKELLLRVNGENVWRGFVATVRRVYAFDAEDRSGLKARFFLIDGFDINILFTKRIVFNESRPKDLTGPIYKVSNTPDTTVLRALFDHYLDLSGDGLNTTQLVENVGVINIDHSAAPIQPSENWANSMRSITALTNAIYYIDPDKNVVHTDVDTPNAPYDLSDVPDNVDSFGYREMDLINDGTGLINDALIWGIALGGSHAVIARDEDATSIAEHGRWQFGELNGAMYKQATVDRRAASIVDGSPLSKRGAKNDKVSVAVTVFTHGLRVAQKVDFTSEVFDFTDVIPIRRMDISFVTKQQPRYRVYLSHEIDMPWNYFDNYYYNFGFPGLDGIQVTWPPPLLVPKICDPEDFILSSTGGAFACVSNTDFGCFSYNYDIGQGDLVYLYGGATYKATYVADRHDANCMSVHVTHVSGAPQVSAVNMGCISNGDPIGPLVTHEFTVPAGFTGYYGTGVATAGYVGFEGIGMSVSTTVAYLSGPDPRFENIDCLPGDTGFGGPGGSQEDEVGDGVTVLFTLTSAYVPGSTRVFVGGLFQRPGFEYTESDPEAGEITFTVAPPSLNAVTVFYQAVGEPS